MTRDWSGNLTPTRSGSDILFNYKTDDWKTDLVIIPRLSGDLSQWADATPEFVTQSGGTTSWRVRVPQSVVKKFMILRAGFAP